MVDEASIIDRIMEAHGHLLPPDGAFTVKDYIDRARLRGVSISAPNALRILLEEVNAGRLHSRKLATDGRERWWFW